MMRNFDLILDFSKETHPQINIANIITIIVIIIIIITIIINNIIIQGCQPPTSSSIEN